MRSYASLLLDDEPTVRGGGAVAIIGAGGIGVDVAHLLSAADAEGDLAAAFYERYGLRAARPERPRSRVRCAGP